MALGATLIGFSLASCGDSAHPQGVAPTSLEESSPDTLEAVLAERDAYLRARGLGALLPALGPERLPDIKELLDNRHLDLRGVELELLLHFWSSHEPIEATEWALRECPPTYRHAAVRTALESLAARDPEAAVAIVGAELAAASEEIARTAQLALVHGWFQKDRSSLERYIYDQGAGMQRQRLLYGYLLTLASAEGSGAVARWPETLNIDDQRYRLAAYRQAMSALSWVDMDTAVRFCDAHCEGPYGKGLRGVLVRTRLRNGDYGGDVVAWIGRMPEEDEAQLGGKHHALGIAYSIWALNERSAALDWMREKVAESDPEPWLPFLYAEFARQLAADSPEEGIEWAQRVAHDAAREVLLVRIARAWRMRDEAAADDWIEQSPLSEAARERARDTSRPTYIPTPGSDSSSG